MRIKWRRETPNGRKCVAYGESVGEVSWLSVSPVLPGKGHENLVTVALELQRFSVMWCCQQLLLVTEKKELHNNVARRAILKTLCQSAMDPIHFKVLYKNEGTSSWNNAVMLDCKSVTVSGMPRMCKLEHLALLWKSSREDCRERFSSCRASNSLEWLCVRISISSAFCFSTEVLRPRSLISHVSRSVIVSEVCFRAFVSICLNCFMRLGCRLSNCKAKEVVLNSVSDSPSCEVPGQDFIEMCGLNGVPGQEVRASTILEDAMRRMSLKVFAFVFCLEPPYTIMVSSKFTEACGGSCDPEAGWVALRLGCVFPQSHGALSQCI